LITAAAGACLADQWVQPIRQPDPSEWCRLPGPASLFEQDEGGEPDLQL